jgi:hypothetical protein
MQFNACGVQRKKCAYKDKRKTSTVNTFLCRAHISFMHKKRERDHHAEWQPDLFSYYISVILLRV